MELSVRKWGNSAGVILPTAALENLQAKVGDTLSVEFDNQKMVVQVAKPRYSLAQLLAQCDPTAPVPADVAEWEAMAPVGNELI